MPRFPIPIDRKSLKNRAFGEKLLGFSRETTYLWRCRSDSGKMASSGARNGLAKETISLDALRNVAVIIPAYNSERSIDRAVRSALDQPEVSEVFVVDDCSRDETVARALASDDGSNRLQVLENRVNTGPAGARNRAIAQSKADFVTPLDADDFFLPGRFGAMTDDGEWAFFADNIVFTRSDGALSFPTDLSDAGGAVTRQLTFDAFVKANMSQQGKHRTELGFLKPVMRRSALDAMDLRYDERMRLGEDFILYATGLARGGSFQLTSHCGYAAVERPNSLSGQHRTGDLAELVMAERTLLKELEARTPSAPPASIAVLRRHLVQNEGKHATRKFLDEKRERGILSAFGPLAGNPKMLLHVAAEIAHGKLGMSASPPREGLRLLFSPDQLESL